VHVWNFGLDEHPSPFHQDHADGADKGAFSDGTCFWPEPLLSQWQKWFMLLKINAGIGPIVTLLGLALIKS
jgi:hypothetical protein